MTILKNEFNLIDGTFTASETNELLSALFMDKIRFHNIKNLSHQERFGKPDVDAQIRIQRLEETLKEVLTFLKNSHQEGDFEIYANITIKPVS